jgi:hypothetical protein
VSDLSHYLAILLSIDLVWSLYVMLVKLAYGMVLITDQYTSVHLNISFVHCQIVLPCL